MARDRIGKALESTVEPPVRGSIRETAVSELAEFIVRESRVHDAKDAVRCDLPSVVRVETGVEHADADVLLASDLVRRVRGELRRRILADVQKLAARSDAIVDFYGLDDLVIAVERADLPSKAPRFEVLQPYRGGSRVGPVLELDWMEKGSAVVRQVTVLNPFTVGRGLEPYDADVTIPDLDEFLAVSREALEVIPILASGAMHCRITGTAGAYHRAAGGAPVHIRVNGVIELVPGDEIWLTPDGSAILRYPTDPEGRS
ncbi:hypothetical protein OVA21_13805 [Dietzia sp. SL131]|uniref:hypothetical protein n=1 Tax=Dietzia sp. SL131 TaxID=2995149 RepID=UPI00227C4C66|nr:hypothetical protein [Dietzia sp. SL131]MCY1658260.1 hypothetical protein [Dietzia sp. SL131]